MAGKREDEGRGGGGRRAGERGAKAANTAPLCSFPTTSSLALPSLFHPPFSSTRWDASVVVVVVVSVPSRLRHHGVDLVLVLHLEVRRRLLLPQTLPVEEEAD